MSCRGRWCSHSHTCVACCAERATSGHAAAACGALLACMCISSCSCGQALCCMASSLLDACCSSATAQLHELLLRLQVLRLHGVILGLQRHAAHDVVHAQCQDACEACTLQQRGGGLCQCNGCLPVMTWSSRHMPDAPTQARAGAVMLSAFTVASVHTLLHMTGSSMLVRSVGAVLCDVVFMWVACVYEQLTFHVGAWRSEACFCRPRGSSARYAAEAAPAAM